MLWEQLVAENTPLRWGGKPPVPKFSAPRAREEPGCFSPALPNLGLPGSAPQEPGTGRPTLPRPQAPWDRMLTGLPSWARAEN